MEQRYTLKEVLNVLGVSRTTLLYYEKQGVIPSRKDSGNGYRYFYHDDVNTLKQCIWLKNLGYSIQEIVELQKTGHMFDLEHIRTYKERLIQKIRFDTAIQNQLKDFENSFEQEPGQFDLVMLPVYCTMFFGCEDGYHRLDQNEDANALIRQMPITGFLLRFDGDFLAGDIRYSVGRCVREAYIPLIFPDGKERHLERFGGGFALRGKYHLRNKELIYKEIEELKIFMENKGYKPKGKAIGLIYLFESETVEILIPVERPV